MNNIEIKTKFWIDLWENLIDNFLEKSLGLTLYSPHILIDDIISEIEENSFKNSDNKKFFYSKLSEYLEKDIVINKNFKSQFKILRRIFNSERTNYILLASKEIKELFQTGHYFDSSLNELIGLLTSDLEISTEFIEKINKLTQGLIVELIKKSYSIEDIKKIPLNIFAGYQIIEGRLITDFPHEIDSKNHYSDNGKFNWEKYNEDVIDHLSNLTEKDRLIKISEYYYKKKERVYYIFVIEGLTGNIELNVGGVTFYSLNKKRFVAGEYSEYDSENLQRTKEDHQFVQVAVEVDYLMSKSSLADAVTKVENALDIISCYFNIKAELFINSSNYIIVKNGSLYSSSMGRDIRRDPFMRFHNSLDMEEYRDPLDRLNKYSFLWDKSNTRNKSVTKISNALHWYRKAEQSLKQEDKMLNYWIAIENLFNLDDGIKLDMLNDSNKTKFHLIQETIVSIQILAFIYDYGWELYHYYSSMADPIFNRLKLPDELIKKAQLNPEVGVKIYLRNFINNLEEIKSYEDNLFYLEKINTLIEFYGNPVSQKKVIDQQMQQIRDDVLMIYRFRNLIVHNAHFDNTLLPYLVWKIKTFSSHLIRRIISEYVAGITLSEIMLKLHLKREKFQSDFENGKVDLFKN